MDGHDVRGLQEIIEGTKLGAGFLRECLRQPWSPGQHPHAEGAAHRCDMLSDLSQTDDPERLAAQRGSQRWRPCPAPHVTVLRRYLPHGCDHETEGELDGPGGMLGVRSSHHDAPLFGGAEIDVARVSAGLRDDPEVRKLLEQLAREERALPVGYQRIEAAQG